EAGYRTAPFHSGRPRYLGMEAVIAQLPNHGGCGRYRRQPQLQLRRGETTTVARILRWIDGTPVRPAVLPHLSAYCRSPPVGNARARRIAERTNSAGTATRCTMAMNRWALMRDWTRAAFPSLFEPRKRWKA